MKLYATITSERATKGQGGNKYINIDLWVGDKNHPITAGSIYFRIENGEYVIMYNDYEIHRQKLPEIKGKQQKDENDELTECEGHPDNCPCMNCNSI